MENFEFYKDAFVDRLKEYMELNGYRSILAFSKFVGLPERTLNGWLRKESTPNMEAIVHLAIKLERSADYLLGLKEE